MAWKEDAIKLEGRNSWIVRTADCVKYMRNMPKSSVDLIITSPPYNIGKSYESRTEINNYLNWQKEVISECSRVLTDSGSICYQVGNYIENGVIEPLDILLHSAFVESDFQLRNRIIWSFGHGLHARRRFSGRYEVVMWYTKGDDYVFNLDDVRTPSKYPLKRAYKGPRKGQISSNPLGKNPEDVWFIPNVKANHVEKYGHPCQFPVGLVERLVLALSMQNQLVFDPFCGVASSGVASLIHGRRYLGLDVSKEFVSLSRVRLKETVNGSVRYRPHGKAIYDHLLSPLSGLSRKGQ